VYFILIYNICTWWRKTWKKKGFSSWSVGNVIRVVTTKGRYSVKENILPTHSVGGFELPAIRRAATEIKAIGMFQILWLHTQNYRARQNKCSCHISRSLFCSSYFFFMKMHTLYYYFESILLILGFNTASLNNLRDQIQDIIPLEKCFCMFDRAEAVFVVAKQPESDIQGVTQI
jgi:hypothetical protein